MQTAENEVIAGEKAEWILEKMGIVPVYVLLIQSHLIRRTASCNAITVNKLRCLSLLHCRVHIPQNNHD